RHVSHDSRYTMANCPGIAAAGLQRCTTSLMGKELCVARAVVTGLGAVTPLGIGVNAFWDGMTSGRSGIRHIEHFDASDLDVKIAGEVPGFEPKEFIDAKMVRRMDRFAQFAVAASREALADANLEITDENRERVG